VPERKFVQLLPIKPTKPPEPISLGWLFCHGDCERFAKVGREMRKSSDGFQKDVKKSSN
jgi:hypothetical protein